MDFNAKETLNSSSIRHSFGGSFTLFSIRFSTIRFDLDLIRIKFEIPAVIEQENNFQKKKFILSVLGSKIDLITIVLIIFILKIVYYSLFLRL